MVEYVWTGKEWVSKETGREIKEETRVTPSGRMVLKEEAKPAYKPKAEPKPKVEPQPVTRKPTVLEEAAAKEKIKREYAAGAVSPALPPTPVSRPPKTYAVAGMGISRAVTPVPKRAAEGLGRATEKALSQDIRRAGEYVYRKTGLTKERFAGTISRALPAKYEKFGAEVIAKGIEFGERKPLTVIGYGAAGLATSAVLGEVGAVAAGIYPVATKILAPTLTIGLTTAYAGGLTYETLKRPPKERAAFLGPELVKAGAFGVGFGLGQRIITPSGPKAPKLIQRPKIKPGKPAKLIQYTKVITPERVTYIVKRPGLRTVSPKLTTYISPRGKYAAAALKAGKYRGYIVTVKGAAVPGVPAVIKPARFRPVTKRLAPPGLPAPQPRLTYVKPVSPKVDVRAIALARITGRAVKPIKPAPKPVFEIYTPVRTAGGQILLQQLELKMKPPKVKVKVKAKTIQRQAQKVKVAVKKKQFSVSQSMQQQQQKVAQSLRMSKAQRLKLAMATTQKQKLAVAQLSEQLQIPTQKQVQAQKQIQKQRMALGIISVSVPAQLQRQKLAVGLIPSYKLKTPTVGVPAFMPSFPRKRIGRRPRKPGKVPFAPRYIPSVEALVFKIKGRKPKRRELFTGLTLRPL